MRIIVVACIITTCSLQLSSQTIFDNYVFSPIALNCSLLDKVKVGIARSHLCSQSGAKITKGIDIFGLTQYCAEEVECSADTYLAPSGLCDYGFNNCYDKPTDVIPRNLFILTGNCSSPIKAPSEEPLDPTMASMKSEKMDYELMNKSHIIHDSLPISFFPLFNQTYVEFGTVGPVTGNRLYCDSVSILTHCYQPKALPNHRYRVYPNIRSQPMVWLGSCYEPVRSISVVDMAKPIVPESPPKLENQDLQVACLRDSIIVQSTKFPIMIKSCGKHSCKSHKLETSPLSIQRSLFSKLWDDKIKIDAWDPSTNSHIGRIAYCDTFSYCECIDCYWCYARLVNPSCYTSGQVIILIFLIYGLVFMIIGVMYVYHKLCQPIQYLRNRINKKRRRPSKNMDHDDNGKSGQPFLEDHVSTSDSESYEMKPVTVKPPQSSVPLAKKRGSLWLAPITLGLVTGGYSFKCDVNHEIGLIGQSCNAELVCNPWSLVPFSLDHAFDTHCFSMATNNEISEVLQIELLSVMDICNKNHLYWTRNVEYVTDHIVHCPSSAYCNKEWCLEVNDNTTIEDLPAISTTKHQTCMLGDACWLDGCLFCSQSCHVIRTRPKASDPLIYEAFSCRSYQRMATIRYRIGDGQWTTERINPGQFILLGEDFGIDSDIAPPPEYTQDTYLSDGNIIAPVTISPPGVPTAGWIGDLQCNTKADALSLQCLMANNVCTCLPKDNEDQCHCRMLDLSKVMKHGQNYSIQTTSSGTPEFDVIPYGKVQLTLKSKKSVNPVSSPKSKCKFTQVKLSGCVNCEISPKLEYICKSLNPQTVALVCGERISPVFCDDKNETRITPYESQESVVYDTCKVMCQPEDVEIRGNLYTAHGSSFVREDSSYYHSEFTTAFLNTWSDPFYLKANVIAIGVYLTIGVLVFKLICK